MNSYPITVMNKLPPSKRELYDVISNLPDYSYKLPDFSSKAVTVNYLLSVAEGKFFAVAKREYKQLKTPVASVRSTFLSNSLKGSPISGSTFRISRTKPR